ncbi:MAG: hypothetical protein JNK90_21770, partial [Planctomycetaceae bacterium]|nr:hypothetical protein [Planctomycetaceae bacterium]
MDHFFRLLGQVASQPPTEKPEGTGFPSPLPQISNEVSEVVQAVWLNLPTNILLGVVLATLAIATAVSQWLQQKPPANINPAMIRR